MCVFCEKMSNFMKIYIFSEWVQSLIVIAIRLHRIIHLRCHWGLSDFVSTRNGHDSIGVTLGKKASRFDEPELHALRHWIVALSLPIAKYHP